jgi:hypothetical protein
MSATTNIALNFIAEYKGRQNLKNAEKDMGSLDAAINKLGRRFAEVFAVNKLVQFGRAAADAFAADQKSAALLANTLSNLGQAFTDVPVEKFITNLSKLNGIAKTDLRNAFDTLVRSTGNASKAQELLSLGLDVSAGTGKDLSLVSTALSKAYAGNYAAISKLGAGITAAELKAKDFTAIQKHLASVFANDASTAADTFAGKMARLKTSFEEFKITIGSGIADAFANLANNTDLSQFQKTMDTVANDVANILRGIGSLGAVFASIKLPSWLTKLIDPTNFGILGFLKQRGEQSKAAADAAAAAARLKVAQGPYKEGYTSTSDHQKYMAAQAQILAAKKAQLAVDNSAKKAAADKLALERASLSLKLAGQTTDMQNIEIQAALQRGQNQQVTDVLLLQRAIITGNADEANILAQKVLSANDLVMSVDGDITKLSTAKDPFKDWPTASQAAKDQIKAIEDALAAIKDKTVTVTVNTVYSTNGVPVGSVALPSNQVTTTGAGTTGTGGTQLPGGGIAGVTDGSGNKFFAPAPGAPSISGIVDLPPTAVGTSSSMFSANPYSSPSYAAANPINVTVTLNGQTVGNAITNAQVDQSASGINPTFQRSGYGSGALPW